MYTEKGKINTTTGTNSEEIHVTCDGKKEVWTNRQDAMAFYKKGICMSEGSERERYASIYTQLLIGSNNCCDE